MAQASSNCGSSFWSISPVSTPDDNLTKVSGWMDKTEEAENVALSINVRTDYQQTSVSVSAPVITVRRKWGTRYPQCNRPYQQKPLGIGIDWTVKGAGSQIATAQPDVKFATSKQSMKLKAGQSWVSPTNGWNPSNSFQVPQFTNTPKQYLPSQRPNFSSNARDDYFIRSTLPKLKLSEFSGDPLEKPEWSQHSKQLYTQRTWTTV